jgi:hypothetical protein
MGVTPEGPSLSDWKGIALAGTAMRPNNANTVAVSTFRMRVPLHLMRQHIVDELNVR